MDIIFKGKKKKIGDSKYVLIPKAIADAMAEDQEYDFHVTDKKKEADNNEQQRNSD